MKVYVIKIYEEEFFPVFVTTDWDEAFDKASEICEEIEGDLVIDTYEIKNKTWNFFTDEPVDSFHYEYCYYKKDEEF